jgi:serine/threonine kinase 16
MNDYTTEEGEKSLLCRALFISCHNSFPRNSLLRVPDWKSQGFTARKLKTYCRCCFAFLCFANEQSVRIRPPIHSASQKEALFVKITARHKKALRFLRHAPRIMMSTLGSWIRWLLDLLQRWIVQKTGKSVTFDTGKRVIAGKQIAEGGFSFVFEAFDETSTKYALKRIHCPDAELLQACRAEAAVHRACKHPNLMPLLGLSIQSTDCYMLFPFCSQSLRDVINRRNPYLNVNNDLRNIHVSAPWSQVTALQIFVRICAGVQALHTRGYSHRDIKVDNVLLLCSQNPTEIQPVVMDFGSAGPLTSEPLGTRSAILNIVDSAAQHTTLPYRPPELFDGGVRIREAPIDFRAVDVWSLGCSLHALLYGASPCECEFTSRGGLKIIECTHLSILGSLPQPKSPPISTWYPCEEIRTRLLEPMLRQDRFERPTLPEVIKSATDVIHMLGGNVVNDVQYFDSDDDETDGLSLLSQVV